MVLSNTVVITHDYRSIDISEALAEISTRGAKILILSRQQVRWLPWVLLKVKSSTPTCTLVDLPFKHISRHAFALKKINGLFFYEEDACQNNIPQSPRYGMFEDFYRKTQPCGVIVTGHMTQKNIASIGINAYFVPKGFPSKLAISKEGERDIHIGFIGRTGSSTYSERLRLLESAQSEIGVNILRTHSPKEYQTTLSRIRFFFSADKGLNEYMAKNFEAMACGCILVAYRQGSGEEEALGLEDMHNCILYRTIEEAKTKIEIVSRNITLYEKIRSASQHTASHWTHKEMGKRIAEIIYQSSRSFKQ